MRPLSTSIASGGSLAIALKALTWLDRPVADPLSFCTAIGDLSGRVDQLHSEVGHLRREVAELRAELVTLRSLLVGESGPEPAAEASGRSNAESEFSLVGDSPPSDLGTGETVRVSLPSEPAGYPTASPAELDWAARERISAQVGRFLAGALVGDIFGPSGRDRIPYRSRFWIVLRSHSGQVFDPARVYTRWAYAKPVVEVDGHFGRAVFVGLPSKREVSVALEAAGLHEPPIYHP